MAFPITNKALIAGIGSVALGGAGYATYAYITTTVTIKDALIKNGKTPLDLDNDNELLNELTRQYLKGTPAGKTKIVGLEIATVEDTEHLMLECQKLFETNSGDKDYKRKLIEAEQWCTKDNSPRQIFSLLPSGRKMLDSSDGEKWDAPWKKFKEDHSTNPPTGVWAIDTWNDIKEKAIGEVSVFKEKCNENSRRPIMPKEQKDLLDQFVSYCTIKDK